MSKRSGASAEIGSARSEAAPPGPVAPMASADDRRLIESLRRGDDAAFAALLELWQAAMLRLARVYVPDGAAAEDVVQETWLGVLRGIDRFEGRSSLKTWVFRILVNRARSRGEREARSVPFSSLWGTVGDRAEAAFERELLELAAGEAPARGAFPRRSDGPEDRLLAGETSAYIRETVEALPPGQRNVITLHDLEGWTSAEVCDELGISGPNQRVLLHRARTRVRRALEQQFSVA